MSAVAGDGRAAGDPAGETADRAADRAARFGLAEVEAAAARIAGRVHRTPVLSSRLLDRELGCQVLAKAEHLQRVGAFKARGAFSALLALDPGTRARGVIAVSSGNHGQAVALAAAEAGGQSGVVMAGQGTAALELLAEVGDLDVVVVPVGGGGLLSGTAAAVKGRSPAVRVVGVEPAGAADARAPPAGGWPCPRRRTRSPTGCGRWSWGSGPSR